MQYRFDDFVLDLDTYRLECRGEPLALEPKAFDLLVLFVTRPGQLLSKAVIFDTIWAETAVTDHALTRVVAQLRRVLGDEAREATYIETVPTRGYRWIRPVVRVDGPDTSRGRQIPVRTGADAPSPLESRGNPSRARVVSVAVLLVAGLTLGLVVWARGWTVPGETRAAEAMDGDVSWPVQLTTNPGLDLQPSLSPDGDAFAYVSDRTGRFEIYVRAFGGTATETALTSDGLHNMQPAWSPDGRFIAYHSTGVGGIWVLPARGGVARQVAAVGSKPVWSPDSRWIAYQSDEQADVTPSAFGAQSGSTIWMVGADGHGARQITRAGQPVGGHASPAWSADGRHLAFTVFEAGEDNGVWVHTLATGETRALLRGPNLYDAVIAPDQSALYVSGGEAFVARVPLDAATFTVAGERELIPVPGVPGVRGLSLSRDGSRLAFAGTGLSSHIWAQPVDREGRPAAAARALTDDTSRRNSLPVVSPDGEQVAYMSSRGGATPQVWVMGTEGQNRVQVSTDGTTNFRPNWLADGQRVVFVSNREGRFGLWAADALTRREELWFELTPGQERASLKGRMAEFDLSPSGTRAAFATVAQATGLRLTFVTALKPFAPRELTDGTRSVGYPSWSPDERLLAVQVKDGASTQAAVLDIDTRALRLVTSERGEFWVRSWSPDGRRLALAAMRGGVWNLQWVDVATGERGDITPPMPPNQYVRYPEWSPRGDLVIYERGELRGNIWQLRVR